MGSKATVAAALLVVLGGCAQGTVPGGREDRIGPDAGTLGTPTPESPGGPDGGSQTPPSSQDPPPDNQDPPPDNQDPPPDNCDPAWVPLLDNGGFDAGRTIWQGDMGTIQSSSMMPIPAQAGTYAAWLTGYNNADEVLFQQVDVPADATALRLTGYRCFVSSDPGATDDHLDVDLFAAGGSLLESLASYNNQDAGSICDWEAFSIDAATAHRGDSIVLQFHGTNGSINPTSFYLDTLRLEAWACP